jgi:hypothetical protein
METKVSLASSQQSATGPQPEPDESISHPPWFYDINFNIILTPAHTFPLSDFLNNIQQA